MNILLPINYTPLALTTTEMVQSTTGFPENCSLFCTLNDKSNELREKVLELVKSNMKEDVNIFVVADLSR